VFAALAESVQERSLTGLAALLALTVPYFCLGLTSAALLVARSSQVGRAYALSLAGSGAGCLLVFPLLNALGAEHALGVVAWMALAAAAVVAGPTLRARLRAPWLAAALVLVLAELAAGRLYAFPPDPGGQLAAFIQRAGVQAQRRGARVDVEREYSRWTETGRVDVFRLSSPLKRLQSWIDGPIETRLFTQDASAGSFLLGVGDDLARARAFFEQTVYGAGYARGPAPDVLVIGVGGSPDVLTALYHGARRIVAVDINRAVVDLARGPFRELLGDPYGRPDVQAVWMDGRTFVRTSDERFDLIQMSGVDTKTVLASGSLALSENYLYTRQALEETLERLKPDGVLVATRFTDFQEHRMASVAVAALEHAGVEDPARHLFALSQGIWRAVLVKRSPFTEQELARLHEFAARTSHPPPIRIPEIDLIAPLRRPIQVAFSPEPRPVAGHPFYQALAAGRLADYVARAPLDLSAPTDDRPYFFFSGRPAEALRDPPEALRGLLALAGQLAGASALILFAPLVLLRRRGLALPGVGWGLVYFTCLGVGFMLIEIGLFHRFVLLLGHQSYAVTVVLFGLLLGASGGSALSGAAFFQRRGALELSVAALVAVVVAYAFGLGVVFDGLTRAAFALRLACSLAVLVLLGLALGVPFPSGLRRLREGGLELVAWAIGVNGFASVVGATLAVPTALLLGLRALLLVGAALYALAVLTLLLARRRAPG
jgi:SAM-dependent methyltransferase